jgi:RNA polymerase sigma-70 factor (ECF subfamily)
MSTALTVDEARLIARVCLGDQNAMAALYDKYSSLVYAVALRVLKDTGSAEDVLQDTFMQLWRSPQSFDAARGNLTAWLAVIARHRAIDLLRKRRPETDIAEITIAGGSSPFEGAERTGTINRINSALAEIPVEQRSALELAFFEGMTHTEIAQRTGEPLGTTKTRIRAALIALRKKLAE